MKRAAVEIGAQGQDQADVGAAARRRTGEARQQHIDEPMKERLVVDQGDDFLELVGDQQDARAFVAAAAIGEDIAQGQFAGLEARRQ